MPNLQTEDHKGTYKYISFKELKEIQFYAEYYNQIDKIERQRTLNNFKASNKERIHIPSNSIKQEHTYHHNFFRPTRIRRY